MQRGSGGGGDGRGVMREGLLAHHPQPIPGSAALLRPGARRMSAVRCLLSRSLQKLLPSVLHQLPPAQRVLLGLVVLLELIESFG